MENVKLLKKVLQEKIITYNISELVPGVYFIVANHKISNQKFIKTTYKE